MKINVVGTTASGKSTFGRKLAESIDVPYVEMDVLFWGPNWHEPSDHEFFSKLESSISSASWVLDGNYSRTMHIKWKDVETVIWLDYSFIRTIYQSISRAFKRAYSKSELWPNTGNVETLAKMFSKDSIILWCLKNYWNNKRKYENLMSNPNYSHIRFVQITSPSQAENYIRSQSVRK